MSHQRLLDFAPTIAGSLTLYRSTKSCLVLRADIALRVIPFCCLFTCHSLSHLRGATRPLSYLLSETRASRRAQITIEKSSF